MHVDTRVLTPMWQLASWLLPVGSIVLGVLRPLANHRWHQERALESLAYPSSAEWGTYGQETASATHVDAMLMANEESVAL